MTGDAFKLMEAFNAHGAELVLEDGRSMKIVINKMSGNVATFLTSGKIPGF